MPSGDARVVARFPVQFEMPPTSTNIVEIIPGDNALLE